MINRTLLRTAAAVILTGFHSSIIIAAEPPKHIALIAGKPSHGPGEHEYNAGCLLFKKCLDQLPQVRTTVHTNGWPADSVALDGVDAVFFFTDGGGKNPAIQEDHTNVLAGLVKKGVGIGFLHYAIDVPKDRGGAQFLDWIGGYYESGFSCNPNFVFEFNQFPEHPITRGVKPFAARDEWYFNLRFREEMKGVTPVLRVKPSDDVRDGPYAGPKGPYDHIVAASGREEVVMWTVERPDGGRGLGFSGGHYHTNWSNPNLRKLVLNSLLWLAKAEVPADGVASEVSEEDLRKNLDVKVRRNPVEPVPGR